ncbi:MAG: hypothetical protein IKY12_05775, partial [Clostridia bacterium]|nr:hypothetical protein [Clostridia bacterium]
MRKNIIKCLLLVCIMLVSFAIVVGASEATVYVASNGSDSAVGTVDAPVATLYQAMSMLHEGGTIKLVDDIMLTATAEKYFLEPAHSGKITVTSADVNSKGGIIFSANCNAYYFGGDAEWNNIRVRANVTSGINISCENNKVTMGEGLEMSHTTGATAGVSGGHTFDGTKIYIFAGYVQGNGHTAAGTGDVGGGELRIYSGEYWFVGAWRASSGSVTGGETLIVVDGKYGDIWLNNLCPTNLNGGSTAFSLAADANGKYPHNIVVIGDNINVNYAYRIAMNKLSGTTNVDWILKGALYGDSTVRSSQSLTPVSPFSLVANVYLDTTDAKTVADATTFMANWSAAFGGDHDINNTIAEYCAANGHSIENYECNYCGLKIADATVYVASNGLDSAAGTSDSPVATLYQAMSMLKEGGTIKLVDDIMLTATAEKYFLEPAHSGKITVTSADINNKGGIVFSANCSAYYFNGEAEWNNILVRANVTSGVNISCENNKVTMGEGLEMSHT